MGRAARNVNGHVILYADKVTKSITQATQETQRRRAKQEEHNTRHGITPATIIKNLGSFDLPVSRTSSRNEQNGRNGIVFTNGRKQTMVVQLTKLMGKAIRKMDYEQALVLREQIQKLKHSNE